MPTFLENLLKLRQTLSFPSLFFITLLLWPSLQLYLNLIVCECFLNFWCRNNPSVNKRRGSTVHEMLQSDQHWLSMAATATMGKHPSFLFLFTFPSVSCTSGLESLPQASFLLITSLGPPSKDVKTARSNPKSSHPAWSPTPSSPTENHGAQTSLHLVSDCEAVGSLIYFHLYCFTSQHP